MWTKHIRDPDSKKRFEESIIGSKIALNRLRDILQEMYQGLDMTELDINRYDEAGWAYRQAHVNGYKSCLNKIDSLLNLDQKEQNDRPI